jgi:hypothetical protein
VAVADGGPLHSVPQKARQGIAISLNALNRLVGHVGDEYVRYDGVVVK